MPSRPSLPALLRAATDEDPRGQSGVAERLGVRQHTVSRWCSGSQVPGLEHVPELARLLGIPQRDVKQLRQEQLDSQRNRSIDSRLEGIESAIKTLAREIRRLGDQLGS